MRPLGLLFMAVVTARTYLPCELKPCPPPGFLPPVPGSIVILMPPNTTTRSIRTTTATTTTTTKKATSSPATIIIPVPRTLAPPSSINPWKPYVWPSGGHVPDGAWPWLVSAPP